MAAPFLRNHPHRHRLLLSSAAEANGLQCEDRAAIAWAMCHPGGGVNDNKCMVSYDRHVTTCLMRSDERWRRDFPMRAWVRRD
jgi:hypothetical protein